MTNITFSMLLTQILNGSGIRYAKTGYEHIHERGVPISYSTFANYKSFTTVPTFNTARSILNCFDYRIDDSELQDIIDYSNRELKANRSGIRRTFQRGISMNPDYFEDGMSVEQLQSMLEDRVTEEFGEDGTINQYISYLVRKDLGDNGLIEISEREDM